MRMWGIHYIGLILDEDVGGFNYACFESYLLLFFLFIFLYLVTYFCSIWFTLIIFIFFVFCDVYTLVFTAFNFAFISMIHFCFKFFPFMLLIFLPTLISLSFVVLQFLFWLFTSCLFDIIFYKWGLFQILKNSLQKADWILICFNHHIKLFFFSVECSLSFLCSRFFSLFFILKNFIGLVVAFFWEIIFE